MSKEFTLAVQEANGQVDETLPFTMQGDDTQLYAFVPTEGQMVLLVGAMNEYSSADQQAAVVLDVFWSLLEDNTAKVIRGRLRDREDTFGLADVMNIIEWIVEESAARPTQSSLASTPSRATSGHLSTGGAPRRASTRSRSPRPVSAT
jgi:hypothetical protein